MDGDRLDVPAVANDAVKMASEIAELQNLKRETYWAVGGFWGTAYAFALCVALVTVIAWRFRFFVLIGAGVVAVIALVFALVRSRREHVAREADLKAEIETGADPYEKI